MALDKYSYEDALLGKALPKGTGTAFVAAMLPVDSTGTPLTGGLASNNTARLLSAAATDNATSVTGAACTLKGIQLYNARASAAFLKLYDKTTAPTSADTPKKTIRLEAASSTFIDMPNGYAFALGLGYRITGAAADNDATALAVGDITCLNLDYVQ